MNKYSNEFIEENEIRNSPQDRACSKALEILESNNYCIDPHIHLFDIKCINKSYFIIRVIKDLLGLKSSSVVYAELSVDEAYEEIENYEEDWEDIFGEELQIKPISPNTKGGIDVWQARKFLRFKKMEDVYNYYINNFSLGKIFNKSVLVTALMMDLEYGWGVKVKKDIFSQVDELKNVSRQHPVLPFLFCDPRRDNLLELFNYAFCGDDPFFGVKLYPALGYDPSDYRLWPIYEVCEKKKIPILTHCGGETISTAKTQFDIYVGKQKIELKAKNRREVAYQLNNPERWRSVLEKFPDLKLNLAHFGGSETWKRPSPVEYKGQKRKEVIFEYMRTYKNVYADFSYNLSEINLTNNLREVLSTHSDILDKSLFGTDYWVVVKEGNLLRIQEEFLEALDRNSKQIKMSEILSITNPKKYLFD